MNFALPLFPEQASTMADRVDTLVLFLVGVSAFFATLICILIITFAIKYRRRSEDERPPDVRSDIRLEIFWTVVPLGLTLIMFFWGAKLYFTTFTPPANALEISVVAKQWMWKVQHPEGQREINELHIPIGWPVKLTLTSQDVIHDFSVPAFRVKRDVVPGRYTTLWFEANKTGAYHLFCDQYCGTQHAGMVGEVVVMTQAQYQSWLEGHTTGISAAAAGETLFQQLACNTCHGESASARGPSLVGLFGQTVKLEGGNVVTADEDYIRESVLNPQAKIVAGYRPIMPTFKGLITEDGILDIVAYLKSLSGEGRQQAKNE